MTSGYRATTSRRRSAQPEVDSLQRGLEILRSFRGGEKSLRFVDIVARTGLPRLTAQKLVNTLVTQRFLRFLPELDRYEPDVSCLVLGHAVRTGLGVLRVAKPILTTFATNFNVDVLIAKREGIQMLVIEHAGSAPEAMVFAPGTLMPMAQSSLGRAWLSAQRPTAQGEFIERIRSSADEQELRAVPAIYRAFQEFSDFGYHISVSDWWGDWQSVSVPLMMPGGREVLSIAASTRRLSSRDAEFRDRIAPALMHAAGEITAETLGNPVDEATP